MSMDKGKIKLLTRQFPKSLIKTRRQSGRNFSYVEGATIIQRLNEVFGHDWSFEIAEKVINIEAGQIAILGRLSVPRILLKNFENRVLEFQDFEKDGEVDKDGNANRYVRPAVIAAACTADKNSQCWRGIASVRISLLLRTIEDGVTQSPQIYTFDGTSVTASDNFLRREYISVIALRNHRS